MKFRLVFFAPIRTVCWYTSGFVLTVTFKGPVYIFRIVLKTVSSFIHFSTDRELELRELRKVVLSSQQENISLNKEMEELKVL